MRVVGAFPGAKISGHIPTQILDQRIVPFLRVLDPAQALKSWHVQRKVNRPDPRWSWKQHTMKNSDKNASLPDEKSITSDAHA
jgi:hypothetical protein